MITPLSHHLYVDGKAVARAVAVYENSQDPRRCKRGGECVAVQEQGCDRAPTLVVDNPTGLCPSCWRRFPEQANKEKKGAPPKGICKNGHDISVVGREAGGRCRQCKRDAAHEASRKGAEVEA